MTLRLLAFSHLAKILPFAGDPEQGKDRNPGAVGRGTGQVDQTFSTQQNLWHLPAGGQKTAQKSVNERTTECH